MLLKYVERDQIFRKSVKIRPVEEIINIQIFRPLAHFLLIYIKDLSIKPEWIVIFHTLIVIISAFILYNSNSYFGNFLVFVLLQFKTVLDNLDGQFARYKEIQSAVGRYLDTLMDYLGNLVVFLSIGLKHNEIILCLISFYVLTWVLSYDFNLERLYKGLEIEQKYQRLNALERFLKLLYDFLLGYQDYVIIIFERFLWVKKGRKDDFWKREYLYFTANMGLSTQLFVLGVFALFGLEKFYLYLPFFCAFIIILLIIYRLFR